MNQTDWHEAVLINAIEVAVEQPGGGATSTKKTKEKKSGGRHRLRNPIHLRLCESTPNPPVVGVVVAYRSSYAASLVPRVPLGPSAIDVRVANAGWHNDTVTPVFITHEPHL